MVRSFQRIHVCSVGNFKGKGDKIAQWVRGNGGTYSKYVNDQVTHLITSKEAYEQNAEPVRKAKQLKIIKIVSLEWLEHSLLAKPKRPLREVSYLWDRIVKKRLLSAQQATKDKERKGRGKGKKAKGEARRPPKSGSVPAGFHIYEQSGVTYSAVLLRAFFQRSREKLKIDIYESDAEPHVYATHARNSRTGFSKSQFLAPVGSKLDIAIVTFKDRFKAESGKDWEERSDVFAPLPKKDESGNILPPHLGWFFYDDESDSLSAFMRNGAMTMLSNDTGLDQNENSLGSNGGALVKDDPQDEWHDTLESIRDAVNE